jgi:hypothetical protein
MVKKICEYPLLPGRVEVFQPVSKFNVLINNEAKSSSSGNSSWYFATYQKW